ncbi:MAG TPA: S-layer homology domain-containing protein [Syntrophomonadaceae bacterium]|nr:S-layer homology domain-containing protein [Syntrophomonadaceae bacterium]
MSTLSSRTVTLLFILFFSLFTLVSPVGPGEAADEFTDIHGHWAEPSIKQLVSMNAISGYLDQTFRPSNTISRAEFAAILMNAFKFQPKNSVVVFLDTYKHWAKEYISNATSYSIVGGYDALHFGPEDPVTREQMAVMIANACKIEGDFQGVGFKDAAQISDWAQPGVAAVIQKNLMSGYPEDNTFRPQALASRAEAAAVISKAIKEKR